MGKAGKRAAQRRQTTRFARLPVAPMESFERDDAAGLEPARAMLAQVAPRSVQSEYLARAKALGELHEWAEGFAKLRERHEVGMAARVAKARALGLSWDKIGSMLGVNGETVRVRYGRPT